MLFAFTPCNNCAVYRPIEVPATISIGISLFASPLNTPQQPKAPREPPPSNIKTFSIPLLLLFRGDNDDEDNISSPLLIMV
jgi:hypothetical protein